MILIIKQGVVEMQGLVSVIIPVYNVTNYLDECLASISKQTYNNLEIIVIDDGSTDGSADKCDSWATKDKRISVLHQANSGVSAARNAGIAAAKGEFITFVDSDDWLELDALEKLVNRIKQHNADLVVCGFINHAVGKSHNIFGCTPTDDCDYADAFIPIIQGISGVWNKVYRREVIYVCEGFVSMPEDISYGEDEVWLYEVLSHCTRITFLPEPVYHWRSRENSMTKSRKVTEKTLTLIEAKKRALQILPPKKEVKEYVQAFAYYSLFTLKVLAYGEKNTEAVEKLDSAINEMGIKESFNKSKHIPKTMKIKNGILRGLLSIKAAPKLVRFIESTY